MTIGEQSLSETFDALRSSIAKVLGYQGAQLRSIGTGFLVDMDGHFVTAHHVVEGCDRLEIVPDNWRHPISAARRLKNRDDMAILKIDYATLDDNFKVRFAPAPVLPRHRHVIAGSEVGLAGYAWGLDSPVESTLFVFKRVVTLNIMHPAHASGLFYYLDGTAIAGMSGGPVFTIGTGEIVGVVVRIQPEKLLEFRTEAGEMELASAEHLTVALQSFYIHTGLDALRCGPDSR